ncbi:alpha/beta fold hydrolase [Rhodococcus sp. AQ5-07]|uniref:alpha/beta fold hydrolase n=1 Tax=Rhodococcus sp. AQ5-07 TaxID=2054902 RepID=UPI000DBF520D|nr:alpha/beta fold hydrolase [Rhodococcus sp. AQ5-07]RAL31795.1 hypothetical protein CVN56_27000 [Rhodococcus sp. AQ5-07]
MTAPTRRGGFSRSLRCRKVLPAALGALLPLVPLVATSAWADSVVIPRAERIEVDPGVQLSADVYKSSADGRSPLIIIPPGYGIPNLTNAVSAAKLASKGYDVVVYAPRGQYASSGENNLIAAADIGDVSKIIDWAGTHLDSDTTRVGMTGVSQGSVISVMAAANDPRIRAVAAMSTSSTTATPLMVNNTWFSQFIQLVKAAQLVNPFGPELATVIDKFDHNDRSGLSEIFSVRSAQSRVAELNKNAPAILIENGWQDSAFPPSGVTSFFDQLTTPKRMMLMPGDHVVPELGGFGGLPNESWDAAGDWFDHFLHGIDNGINEGKPVQLQPLFGGPFTGFDSWQASVSPTDRRILGPLADAERGAGELGAASATTWSKSIVGGPNPGADSGPLILAGLGAPRHVTFPGFLNAVDRSRAAVWETTPTTADRTISGAPALSVTVTPSDAAFSIFSYLYDIDENGGATLLGHIPFTATDIEAGIPIAVDVSFQPVRYTVQAGHRLALVVDTEDERYESETALGERLTFESTSASPAVLDVPWQQ